MLYNKVLWKKTTLSRIGGSVGSCFAWTPIGDTWATSITPEGGEITFQSKNPDWRMDIARGKSATTSFNANVIEIDFTAGFYESRRLCNVLVGGVWTERWGVETLSGFTNDGFSDVSTPLAPSTNIDPVVDAQARLAFVKRAREAQGSFRGATFLAELADTLRSIRNPLRGLRSSVDEYSTVARRRVAKAIGRDPRGKRVRDLTKRQSRAAQRALSDSWLEAQFGWLPLVNDVRDGWEAYNEFSRRVPREPIWSRGVSSTAPVITFHPSSSRNLQTRTEVHSSTTNEVRYYGAVKLSTSSFHSDLVEEAGFKVRDFLPALWEWIPYSFLVDYFTNVGDMIEAAAFPRSNLAWAARTYRNTAVRDGTRSTVTTISSNPYPQTNYTKVVAAYPSAIFIRRKYVSRAEYLGSFVPDFQLEIPGYRNYKKYLNIGALLHLRGMKR